MYTAALFTLLAGSARKHHHPHLTREVQSAETRLKLYSGYAPSPGVDEATNPNSRPHPSWLPGHLQFRSSHLQRMFVG